MATPEQTPPTAITSLVIIQSADGRLFVKITSDQAQYKLDQAVIQYNTFVIAAARSTQQKDSV